MAGFFDKVKQGVSETGKQAKIAVETNRLKMQINMKQKEIDEKFKTIGQLVYQSYKSDDFSSITSNLEQIYLEIGALETEIESINKQILDVKDTKECVCGNLVPNDTRFCNQCGHKFELMTPPAAAAENGAAANTQQCKCGNMMDAQAKFCNVCGERLQA